MIHHKKCVESCDSRAFLGGWFFPADCVFPAIGVTFTPPRLTKFCHVHDIVRNTQMKSAASEKLALVCKEVGTRVMILAKNEIVMTNRNLRSRNR